MATETARVYNFELEGLIRQRDQLTARLKAGTCPEELVPEFLGCIDDINACLEDHHYGR